MATIRVKRVVFRIDILTNQNPIASDRNIFDTNVLETNLIALCPQGEQIETFNLAMGNCVFIVAPDVRLALGRAMLADHAARPAFRYAQLGDHVIDRIAFAGGAQNFP